MNAYVMSSLFKRCIFYKMAEETLASLCTSSCRRQRILYNIVHFRQIIYTNYINIIILNSQTIYMVCCMFWDIVEGGVMYMVKEGVREGRSLLAEGGKDRGMLILWVLSGLTRLGFLACHLGSIHQYLMTHSYTGLQDSTQGK